MNLNKAGKNSDEPLICTICARGGSQRLKNKNIKDLCGRPLLSWTIDQAKKTGLSDVIAVSSDSEEILDIAAQSKVDYLIQRPTELATHESGKVPVIRHALLQAEKHFGIEFKSLVDLDCTSPLRSNEDLLGAFELFKLSQASNLITGSPSRRSPYFNLIEKDGQGKFNVSKPQNPPFLRRQDAPQTYDMNASIYIWKRDILLKENQIFLKDTQFYEMPEERSFDIDTELDFLIVEAIAKQRIEFQRTD